MLCCLSVADCFNPELKGKGELSLYVLYAARWLDDSKLCCLSLADCFNYELEGWGELSLYVLQGAR